MKITLETGIQAPPQKAFDLSRSIDLHVESTKRTGEQAIAGKTSGLISLNETVTWRARHLGVWQTFTSKITAMDPPHHFVDEMVKGAFKNFRHEHFFFEREGGTLMIDKLEFQAPYGLLGTLADQLVLKRYLTVFLKERNKHIKKCAEHAT